MALPGLFQVATEFRFEIGSALLGTERLTDSVNKLSSTVDGALTSFKRLSIGVIANFGLGGTSVVGVLGTAIKASEQFKKTQLSFVNIIAANKANLVGPINTFADQLLFSKQIMYDISDIASKFSLPEAELMETSKLISAMLIPHGLAGDNFGTAISMSRSFLKSAPTLGIDPQMAMSQLIRTIQGGASSGDPLFQRLVSDTAPMKEFANHTEKFNKLDPAKRVDILNRALQQFSSNADVISGFAETMSAQLHNLKAAFVGVKGVLIPIGDVILPVVVDALKMLIQYVRTYGRTIAENLARFIKPFLTDMNGTILTLLQLKNVSADINRTKSLFSVVVGFSGIGWILSKITRIAMFAHPAIGAVAAALYFLYDISSRVQGPFKYLGSILTTIAGGGALVGVLAIFGKLGWVVKAFGFIFKGLLGPIGLAMIGFQVVSRAVAKAQVKDFKFAPEQIARFSGYVLRLKEGLSRLVTPFTYVLDKIADYISFLFSNASTIDWVLDKMDTLITFLEDLGLAFATITADIAGAATVIYELLDRGLTLNFENIVGASFETGIRKSMDILSEMGYSYDAEGNVERKNVSNKQTNIYGGVKIENKFKDQMEPDRIAFTIKEQLLKAARNPTQANTYSKASAAMGQ